MFNLLFVAKYKHKYHFWHEHWRQTFEFATLKLATKIAIFLFLNTSLTMTMNWDLIIIALPTAHPHYKYHDKYTLHYFTYIFSHKKLITNFGYYCRFGKRSGFGLNERNLETMQSYQPQLMGFVSHSVWKSPKKSHSTLRAKQATFIFH